MTISASEVVEARRLRSAAKAVFDTQKQMVRSDLDAAGVGKRVVSRIEDDGRRMLDTAHDAAEERPVVAAGALMLTAWALSKPLASLWASIIGYEIVDDDDDYADEAEPRPADA